MAFEAIPSFPNPEKYSQSLFLVRNIPPFLLFATLARKGGLLQLMIFRFARDALRSARSGGGGTDDIGNYKTRPQGEIMETPAKPIVLFLEDDADTRALVKFTLERAGLDVILAETVPDAWHAALAYEIDLYLLDCMLPNGDCLKLCRDVRAIEPTKPILFLSGLAYKADIQKGIDAGATAYLVKPYDGDLADELLQYIRKEKPAEPVAENAARIVECPVMIHRENPIEPIAGRTADL